MWVKQKYLIHLVMQSRADNKSLQISSSSGLGFTQPSVLLTLTSSVKPAAARTADIRTNLQLSCFMSKQTCQSEAGRLALCQWVISSYDWVFLGLLSQFRNELPVRTCIRLTPHTCQPHFYQISSDMFKSEKKRMVMNAKWNQ